MSELKYPFYQQELNSVAGTVDCTNFDCIKTRGWYGNKELWEELIRTRKALDVARNGLEYIFGYEGVPKYVAKHVRQVLDQIKSETALEQKD